MSTVVGYYRYKINAVAAAGNTVTFTIIDNLGNHTHKVCNVIPLSFCAGKKIIKYLNKDGQYRFFAFQNKYEERDSPKEIGRVNSMITSILTSKAESRSVGYKSDRTLSLVSDPITSDQLDIIKDLYTSPRVYLYIGTSTDTESDWILVTVKADKSIRHQAKKNFTRISLEVTLPETYSIKML